MKNTVSMKYNKDFRRLYRRGRSIAAGYLVLYYRRCESQYNTLGLTVTKKLGNAVTRNRVRRLIRESYRLQEDALALGYQLVFVARNRAANASYHQIYCDMKYLLKKSGLLREEGAAMSCQ